METSPPYTATSTTAPRLPHVKRCHCGEPIGNLIDVNGRVWLQVGGVKVRNMHGACSACGGIVHFNTLDYLLADITGVSVEKLNEKDGE